MEIARDGRKKLLYLTQKENLEKVLKRFSMFEVKGVQLPMITFQVIQGSVTKDRGGEGGTYGLNTICECCGIYYVCHGMHKT